MSRLDRNLGVAFQTHLDIDIAVKEVLRTKQDLYEILSYHTGQTVQQIEKDAQRDFWMSSEDAKEYGLIDQVIYQR